MQHDFLASLNPRQRAAVELPAEHALILAGAGSGKTRVLTTRIAWLISQGLAAPWQVLAVTFTNKAAREMKARISAMLPADTSEMWMGTFHGTAHRILRRHWQEAGLPRTFQIIDSSDQAALVKRIIRDLNLDPERFEARSWQGRINRFKEGGLRWADVTASGQSMTEGSFASGIYEEYEKRCQREGLVDFAELLLRCVELFEKNQVLREHYAKRFRFILVDEFQDTNALQYRWIKSLSRPGAGEGSVFCVGDDDQSIYAFRGALVSNMSDFIRDYAVRHLVRLEQNYRSTSHILEAANAVIANNPGRLGKKLWTDAGEGEPIGLYEAFDDADEARTLAQDIMARHRRGLPYASFAVLYRNNAQSRIVEQVLNANGIPYRIYGGLRFFDRQEVKDLTAYLRMAAGADDTSLLRVINQPPRGIGHATLHGLMNEAAGTGDTLWDTLLRQAAGPGRKHLKEFADIIATLRESAGLMGLAEFSRKAAEISGLMDWYKSRKDGDIRVENLEEAVNAAAGFCLENNIPQDQPASGNAPGSDMSPLDGFLSQAALEADDRNRAADNDAVQLMTVHASKGLEFPAVYLCGLEQNLFPHHASDDKDAEAQLSEERRLMYVAMTRARKYLRISWCLERRMYGRVCENLRSEFIDEIPACHAVEIGSRSSPFASFRSVRRPGWGMEVRRASDLLPEPEKPASTAGFQPSSLKKKENRWGLNPGDRVRHPKFGPGTVQYLRHPDKPDIAVVGIKFGSGAKELLLSIVHDRLEKL